MADGPLTKLGQDIGESIRQFHANKKEREQLSTMAEMLMRIYGKDPEFSTTFAKEISKIPSASTSALKGIIGGMATYANERDLEAKRQYMESQGAAQMMNVFKHYADIQAQQRLAQELQQFLAGGGQTGKQQGNLGGILNAYIAARQTPPEGLLKAWATPEPDRLTVGEEIPSTVPGYRMVATTPGSATPLREPGLDEKKSKEFTNALIKITGGKRPTVEQIVQAANETGYNLREIPSWLLPETLNMQQVIAQMLMGGNTGLRPPYEPVAPTATPKTFEQEFDEWWDVNKRKN